MNIIIYLLNLANDLYYNHYKKKFIIIIKKNNKITLLDNDKYILEEDKNDKDKKI